MTTNFNVIGLTRLEMKPKSSAPEADAFTTRSSELLNEMSFDLKYFCVYANVW